MKQSLIGDSSRDGFGSSLLLSSQQDGLRQSDMLTAPYLQASTTNNLTSMPTSNAGNSYQSPE